MINIDFANIKPLIHKGEIQVRLDKKTGNPTGYYVDPAGKIISVRELSPCVSGRSPYQKVGVTLNDGKKTTVPVHQMVASTFITQKERRPEGISASDWKKTPPEVRKLLTSKMTDVHHKNGDKLDNRLDNLEFMCASKNRSMGNPNK